jgi:Amt family ammonium transporter
MGALAIGAFTGCVCYGGVLLKGRLGYDDSLDAFGVHGLGGAFGAVATGVFALKAVNPAGADGLVAAGSLVLVGKQLAGVVVAGAYAGAVTWVLLKVLGATMGLRVSTDQEREGLDTALHGEIGYTLGNSASSLFRG